MKRLFIITAFLLPVACLAGNGPGEVGDLASDIGGARNQVIVAMKALCCVAACIGLVNIVRKSQTENGHAPGEIAKWALVLTIGAGGFAALHLIF